MKNLLSLIFIILVLANSLRAQTQENLPKIAPNPDRPTVALVLSGGGAKGFAHLGVLKVLEEENIPIDLIVGTSIGSLVGGFYAMGYSADSLLHLVNSQDWDTLLSDAVSRRHISPPSRTIKQRYLVSLPIKNKQLLLPQGAMSGQNVLTLFSGISANVPKDANFMNFPIPFASISADITNGDEVISTSGDIVEAMYASMAVPGAFEPARIGDQVLVDGGIVNNFPLDVAKNMGADIIIGVDLRDAYLQSDEINSAADVISNIVNIYSKYKDVYLPLADVIVLPKLDDYTAADFSAEACDTLYERGVEATMAHIETIRELQKEFHLERTKKTSDRLIKKNKWYISEIEFESDKQYNTDYLTQIANLPLDETYTYFDIKQAVDRLYGLDGFKYVGFEIVPGMGSDKLVFKLTTQPAATQHVGLQVNTVDVASLLLNLTLKDYSKPLAFFSASAELSANPGLEIIGETNWRNWPNLGFCLQAKYQDYSMYVDGDKIGSSDLFYSVGKLYLEQRLSNLRLGASVQQEYYEAELYNSSSYLLTGATGYIGYDNLDDFYFPSKGTNTYGEISFDADNKNGGDVSSYALFRTENYIPILPKLTLLANAYGRAIISDSYADIKTTLVGGEPYAQSLPFHFPFLGMPPVALVDRYAGIVAVGLRFRVAKSHYITGLFNTLQQGNLDDIYLTDKAVYGGGFKYSMKSIIGPLEIAVGFSNYQSRPTFSANLGLWF